MMLNYTHARPGAAIRGAVRGMLSGARLGLVALTVMLAASSAKAQTLSASVGKVVMRDAIPLALNDSGTIVGRTAARRAFLKPRDGTPIDIDVAAGGFIPKAVNASGVVVGNVPVGYRSQAMTWSARRGHQLVPVPPGAARPSADEASLVATGIDDAGNVLLVGSGPSFADPSSRWMTRSYLHNLESGLTVQLNCLDSTTQCDADALNPNGGIVGVASGFQGWTTNPRAVVWSGSAAQPRAVAWPFAAGVATFAAINSSGAFTLSTATQPFMFGVWMPQDSAPRVFYDSSAQGISDAGIIAGAVVTGSGERARLWSVGGARGGALLELQVDEPHVRSAAVAINNAGVVVGVIVDNQDRRHIVIYEGVSLSN